MHEREKLIKEMKLKERRAENEPQIVIERVRRNSVLQKFTGSQDVLNEKSSESHATSSSAAAAAAATSASANAGSPKHNSPTRRPSVFESETIRKMHSAVELNQKILEKSKSASLVLMNIPEPPKILGSSAYNCKLFVYIFSFLLLLLLSRI